MVTMQEILTQLSEHGISAERKSIYDDMEVLRDFGMEIKYHRGKPGGYYLAGQTAPTLAEPASGNRQTQEMERESEISSGPEMSQVQQAASRQEGRPEETAVEAKASAGVGPTFWDFTGAPGSEAKAIRLLCENSVREEVEACFGTEIPYKEKSPGYFSIQIEVAENPRLFGWITAMGGRVRIAKPKKAAQAFRDYLKMLARDYKGI